jgi:hypothetical protein
MNGLKTPLFPLCRNEWPPAVPSEAEPQEIDSEV